MAETPPPKNYTWYIVAGVVLLLLIIFFIVPAWKGYKVYSALHDAGVDDSYVTDMEGLAKAKESAEARASAAESTAQQAQQRVNEAASAKAAADSARDSCETKAAADKKLCNDLADSLSQEKADVKEELEDAENALKDSANQLCCVQKIFDTDITGYEIEEGEVSCVTEDGEGLNC